MNTEFSNGMQNARAFERVLIVDDEPHVLAVARMMLESQGFVVVGSETGAGALQLLAESIEKQQRFGVVVLDLTMPGDLSGFEVLEQIQEIAPDLPVIACSGYFQEDARELCRGIGFVDVLQKPYALEHLCATVRRHLVRDRSPSSMPA